MKRTLNCVFKTKLIMMLISLVLKTLDLLNSIKINAPVDEH